MITNQTNLEELLEIAKKTLCEVETGEKFIVKDLFRIFEWNRIPKGYRTKLGSMFLLYSNGDGAEEIRALGKTPQNQQIYEKL